MRRLLPMLALVCASLAMPVSPAGAAAPWSDPAQLAGCTAAGEPLIAFPGSSPFARTGPGGIVWGDGSAACLAPLGVAGAPGPAAGLPAAFTAPELLAGTSAGQLAAVGTLRGRSGGLLVTRAGQYAVSPQPLGGAAQPSAVTTAYRGDVAVAATSTRRVTLRIQRHGEAAFGPGRSIAKAPAKISALAVNLDYRTDAIVAWISAGSVWARELPASGRSQPVQWLGAAGPDSRLQALISDDGRAIVAWSGERSAAGGRLGRVYLDISSPGVVFDHRAQLIDSFTEPAGAALPQGSLRLVRLSGESVRLAWTSVWSGRYVVRVSSVSLGGLHGTQMFGDPTRDAVLGDFAPGPRGDALLLWSAMPRTSGGALDTNARGILAANLLRNSALIEIVAEPGPNGPPHAAFDQNTDVAVATWRTSKGVGYALRDPVAASGSSFPDVRASALVLALAVLR